MNRLVSIFFYTQILFVLTLAKCPEGMVPSFSDNSTCYLFVAEKHPFFIAEEICNKYNGHLASIHDSLDNAVIRENAQQNFTESVSSDFWIGLNNLETPGFSWIDGTPIDFADWDKGQPQNGPGYNCVAVKLDGGAWISDDCDKLKPSVCIVKTVHLTTTTTSTTTTAPVKTTSKPKTCPPSWVYYDVTGFCYLVVNNASTWDNAEDWCFSQGGHLASIHSLAENSFVTNLIPFDPNNHNCNDAQGVFKGLYTTTNEQTWRWSDDSPFNFTAWAPGQPSYSQNRICGLILNGPPCGAPAATWANYYCIELYQHFTCKKSLL